jgi:uncharacterized membrane protein YesL
MQNIIAQSNTDEKKAALNRRNSAERMAQSFSSTAWLLLRLNLLFLLFCIPVITAFASASAMAKVLMKHVKKDDFEIWNDFLKEFKSNFLKSTAAGLIMSACVAAVFFTGYFIHILFGGFAGSLGIAFIICFEALLYFSMCYLFPVISTVELSLGQSLKNSFLLALIGIRRNLLLLIPLVLLIACVLLYPVTLPLLIFVIFSLCQFVVCHTVSDVIQKRIIDPYYNKHAGESPDAKHNI